MRRFNGSEILLHKMLDAIQGLTLRLQFLSSTAQLDQFDHDLKKEVLLAKELGTVLLQLTTELAKTHDKSGCKTKGCSKPGIYGWSNFSKGQMCSFHKMRGMVPVPLRGIELRAVQDGPDLLYEREQMGELCQSRGASILGAEKTVPSTLGASTGAGYKEQALWTRRTRSASRLGAANSPSLMLRVRRAAGSAGRHQCWPRQGWGGGRGGAAGPEGRCRSGGLPESRGRSPERCGRPGGRAESGGPDSEASVDDGTARAVTWTAVVN